MQLVNVSEGGFHLSREVWIYFAVTMPLTFVTIVGWLLAMRREKARQKLSESRESHVADDLDAELGLQLNDIK
jgi:hypothetical protein